MKLIALGFLISVVAYFLWEIALIFYPSERVRMIPEKGKSDVQEP